MKRDAHRRSASRPLENRLARYGCETLEDRCLLTIDLVADINQTGAGSDPSFFEVIGSTAYFAATDITSGTELWKTNGTAAGTVLVKDIFTGADGEYPNSSEPRYLTGFGGTLYFSAFDPIRGRELWKSNGTAASTTRVKDIWPGEQDAGPTSLTPSGTLLYFRATDPTIGSQLWKTNGTSAGTVPITSSGNGGNPRNLTDVNGTLYFVGEAPGGEALYRTSGTTISPISIPLAESHNISWLVQVGNKLYFTTTSSTAGNTLWQTTGGAATQVANFGTGTDSEIAFLVNANGTLFFSVGRDKLYKHTTGAPILVKTVEPGNFGPFAAVGSKVFFTADNGVNSRQLWVSDGTAAGTKQVKVIGDGTTGPLNLSNVGGVLYFSADNGVAGEELWKSDGTAAGTVQVKNIAAGSASSSPRFITDFGGLALFQATDTKFASQVWKSNGTSAGTVRVSNINASATDDAFPSKIVDVGGTAYFFADDGVHGQELWRTTPFAAELVADINPGPNGALQNVGSDSNSVNVNGTLYFVANDGVRGVELWKTNASGTSLVKDINPGAGFSNPQQLTQVGNLVYFTATDGVNGIKLWKSNGTAAGTVPLGPANSNPQELTAVGSTLFFSATDATRGTELWKTNGTPAGTVLVRDIKQNTGSSFPSELTNVNGTLFFRADDGVNGSQLWKSGGTAASTTIVKVINPGFPTGLTNFLGTLFFSIQDSSGTDLWKSDGTSTRTQRVLGDNPPDNAGYPKQLTDVNGTLFFVAGSDPYYDRTLWKSDGTAAGTVFVAQVNRPQELTAVGDTLYYREPNSGNGESLWQSDGTAAGTVELQHYGDGSSSYYDLYPGNLTNVGGKLYFSAGDLQHGNELRLHSPEFIIPSETEITASQTSAVVGEEVILTATVDAMPPYGGNPTGTVTFRSGTTHLGTATLSLVDGEKRASIVVSSPVAGTFSITAEYSGDVNFAPSTSPPMQATVYPAPTAATLSPQSMTATDGALPYQANVKSSVPGQISSANVGPSESTTGLPRRNRLWGVAAERLFGVADIWWL